MWKAERGQATDRWLYTKDEKGRRGVDGPVGRSLLRRMLRSVATVAKITLICLNIWVLAVVLVVSLGHWRVFETVDSSAMFDNSHLVVMRELKEDADRKLPIMAKSVTNISEVESYYVPAEHDTIFNLDFIDKENDPGKSKGGGGGAASSQKALSKNGDPNKKPDGQASKGSKPALKEVAPPVANPQPPAPDKPKPKDNPAQPAQSVSQEAAQTRLKNLQHWCHTHHAKKIPYEKIPASKLTYIVYDERHKFMFCQIPGAALNDMRKIMLITSKVVNKTSPSLIPGGDVFGKYGKSLKRLSDVSDASQRAKMLSTYHKVVFVRDPLGRLLDTYKAKFKSPSSKYFHQVFGSPIIKRYRRGASDSVVKSGSSVKFSEFVKYIIDTEREGKVAFNEHWQQYYKQCHPCMVDYHFVGTHENGESDLRSVVQQINAHTEVKPPYMSGRQNMSDKELTAAYKEVDVETLKKLYKVYQDDYSLFGYKCPAFLHDMLDADDAFHDY